jgi:predicted Zn-ribbon and HTH transcriptional regulator
VIYLDNKEKVIKAFKDSEEPLNATKVSAISGVEKKEVDKIMKELKKNETIYSPKRCYWTIK